MVTMSKTAVSDQCARDHLSGDRRGLGARPADVMRTNYRPKPCIFRARAIATGRRLGCARYHHCLFTGCSKSTLALPASTSALPRQLFRLLLVKVCGTALLWTSVPSSQSRRFVSTTIGFGIRRDVIIFPIHHDHHGRPTLKP